ncbi:MAG: hypothetical protein FJ297_00575 [Planctomycetes bacterium]|nr:hypothetical protein [Planctomycetota bacterium]
MIRVKSVLAAVVFHTAALCGPRLWSLDDVEWTLEQARACWQPMVRPVQHVGVPGYQFQAGVMWDGSLVFGPLDWLQLQVMRAERAPLGETRLHLSVGFGDSMRFVDRKGTANPLLRRWLEEGRLPIPHVLTRDGDLTWDETVFAHLLDGEFDDGMKLAKNGTLVTHAVFRVKNEGLVHRTGHLWLHFGTTDKVHFGYKCAQLPDLASSIEHTYHEPNGTVGDLVRYVMPAPERGEIRWHDAIDPPPDTSTPAQRLIEWRVELAPGEEASARLSLPYGHVDAATGARIAAIDVAAELDKTRDFWRRIERGAGQIITPDPFVNDYLAAVPGQMAQQIAHRARTGVWMYKTSPNHYEGYWPCNAAKALPALDLRGLDSMVEPVLGEFVRQQTGDVRNMHKGALGNEQGLRSEGFEERHGFLGAFGEWTANPLLVSHGLGLWALASHYRILRDRDWLGEGPGSPLQAMLDGFDWVSAQRRRTMREVDGVKVEHWGLLPAASAHDWLAGNTIFNDAYCIFGMAEVARLLREIEHPKADAFAKEVADYRACLRDRYVAARDRAEPIPLPDGSSLPYVPRIVQELDWRRLDWTYSGYSPVRAGAWGALDPHDELVTQSLAFLEGGMPRAQGSYFGAARAAASEAVGARPAADINWADVSDPNAPRHHMWRHYVEYETMWPIGGPLFLARDDLPRFFEWLFHNLAVTIHQDWRVGVESLDGAPSTAPGEGERWQYVRRMFVNEREGWDGSAQSLWFMQAVPRCWLRPNDRIAVRDMRTWFGGRVDLESHVAADGDSIDVHLRWRDLAASPARIVIRLRSGDGRPLRAARINDQPVGVHSGDLVELPLEREADLRISGIFAP